MKYFSLILLPMLLSCLFLSSPALAQDLGSARTAGELLSLLKEAQDGDRIRVQGELDLSGITFCSSASVTITSSGRTATLYNLSLKDSNITLSNVKVVGSLEVSGNSSLILKDKTLVKGAPGRDALVFSGSGTLIIEKGCSVTGGSSEKKGGSAVRIDHKGGDFYAGMEGILTGGNGDTAGSGLTVSHLSSDGAMMLDGCITGGDGTTVGGNAVNLYELSSNAFVSVSGDLTGGDGKIAGSGAQLVSLNDSAYVGMEGTLSGGNGMIHGGDALLVMNASGTSAVSVSGTLSGGKVVADDGEPGLSLLVPDNSMTHTILDDCLLQDGSHGDIDSLEHVLPEITSSVSNVTTIQATPEPETEAPSQTVQETVSGELPVPEPTPQPLPPEAEASVPEESFPPEPEEAPEILSDQPEESPAAEAAVLPEISDEPEISASPENTTPAPEEDIPASSEPATAVLTEEPVSDSEAPSVSGRDEENSEEQEP